MENWIKAYLEVMQSCNGMDDESQSQLARRIEKVVKAVENTTGKQVREVKITRSGDVITIIDDERWMYENPWLFEEPNSVAGFNDLNKLQESQEALQEAQKETGKLIQRLHDMQKAEKTAQRRAEEAEKQVAKLREVDEKRQCEINNFRSLVSKKEEKATKLEKRIAKALEERVASEEALRVALRKAQAERDATSKKKSAKIENLQKVNSELKKTINEINTSRENDQALNAAVMKSQEEKLVAKMKVEQEDHTANVRIMEGKHEELTIKTEDLEERFAAEMKVQQEGYASILQRKCEEIEVLQQAIEEKEIRDTVMAAVDVLCHNVAADLKDVELTGDTGHVNAVSDDTQKVWEICEAPEAEMTTQSEKEGMIVIAVEEKALQGSVQGGSTIAAEEIFEAKKVEMSTTQSEKKCRIVNAVEGKALQENMQGDTAIVAEKTKSRQKRTKKKAKKVHEVQHDYPWMPGYQPRKIPPEDLEIMLNYCLGKTTIGDTKAKLLRTK